MDLNIDLSWSQWHLLLEPLHLSGSRIHVENRLVFDFPRSVCITQRVDGLLDVGVGRTDARDH